MSRRFLLGCAALVMASTAGCAFESQSESDPALGVSTSDLTGRQYFWHQIGVGTAATRAYLDVQGGGTDNGTPVWTWPFNGTPAQQWQHSPENGAIINASGKCLDVQGGGTANGTPVQIWDCNGTGAQSWTHFGSSQLMNGGSFKCLDVPNNDSSPRQLQIWDCNGTMAQYWGQAPF